MKHYWESKMDFIILQPFFSKWGVESEKVKLKIEK